MAEEARLESVCTPKGYREFESRSLRTKECSPAQCAGLFSAPARRKLASVRDRGRKLADDRRSRAAFYALQDLPGGHRDVRGSGSDRANLALPSTAAEAAIVASLLHTAPSLHGPHRFQGFSGPTVTGVTRAGSICPRIRPDRAIIPFCFRDRGKDKAEGAARKMFGIKTKRFSIFANRL